MENRWVRGYAIWEEKVIVGLSSNFDHSQLFISHNGRAFPQTSRKCQRGKKEEHQAQKQCNSGCTITPACTAVRQYQHLSLAIEQGQPQGPVLQWAALKEQHSLDSLAMLREKLAQPKGTCAHSHSDVAPWDKGVSLLEFSTFPASVQATQLAYAKL